MHQNTASFCIFWPFSSKEPQQARKLQHGSVRPHSAKIAVSHSASSFLAFKIWAIPLSEKSWTMGTTICNYLKLKSWEYKLVQSVFNFNNDFILKQIDWTDQLKYCPSLVTIFSTSKGIFKSYIGKSLVIWVDPSYKPIFSFFKRIETMTC